ncbi:MAG: DUF4299 family protein [Clostridia bacterium]|nr:DUF4299 family protein [Clostridia bacterium]
MSIDVVINQRNLIKKKLPLSVILGDELKYGAFENDHLNPGVVDKNDFIAFHPKHIGRGFSVIWNEKAKNAVELRLLHPTTPDELSDFYAAIKRIAKYWNGILFVDGKRTSLAKFLMGYDDAVSFNEGIIKQFSGEVLSGKHDTLTFYSAMFPLYIGKDEAKLFTDDVNIYYQWLHEKQSVSARYASAEFYQTEKGIVGEFTLSAGESVLLSQIPIVPFGMTDEQTGEPLECKKFRVSLISEDGKKIATVHYGDFWKRLPKAKMRKFDGKQTLIAPLTEEELQSLIED